MRTKLALALLLAYPTVLWAENWPSLRGPAFNGTSTETNLPNQWSRTENIAWKADLPGPSAATPIIWGDHVFVSSTNLEDDSLWALCLRRTDGKLAWKQEIGKGIRRDTRSTFAAPSPVTDGNVVVFFYGNGPMVAFDFDGKEVWRRNIVEEFGEFAFMWTFSSSPVMYDGKLFLQVLQRDTPVSGRGFADKPNDSYLLAMNPQTGKTLWRYVRPSEAQQESREAFTTPVPIEYNGKKQLLVIGGDDLTSHDLETGAELFRWGTWNPQRIGHWRHVPSPIAGDGIVLVCAPKRDPIYAIKLGSSGKLDDNAVAWVSDEERDVSSDVPTPAFYDGDFIVLSDVRKKLMRIEPATGQVKWAVETPGREKFEASPTVADGKIYIVNFNGDVVVFDANDGSMVHQVSMSEASENPVRSSIVVSQGQLFIRTNDALYCVGAK
ncbi:MAG: PQQ-binding-like beta-propeller repeat protein [Planctomycetales bacterium]|nr:PQQ-binding-like beta-propeller repeat protein [Planctomycetales bacterium]